MKPIVCQVITKLEEQQYTTVRAFVADVHSVLCDAAVVAMAMSSREFQKTIITAIDGLHEEARTRMMSQSPGLPVPVSESDSESESAPRLST